MSSIRVAIVGAGNCASALVRGRYYYEDADGDANGVMTQALGGYDVTDIEPVCAFDVDERKVGTDLATAIAANTDEPFASVPEEIGCPVYRGPVQDGVAEHMHSSETADSFDVAEDVEPVDIVEKLRAHDADVVINYLPVGSEEATKVYAEACLEAGVAFINAMPVFIASDESWAARFEEAGLPIVGDDIKSQLGATVLHQQLVQLFRDRGIELENTYQLNFGGNTDFRNMLDQDRLTSKKESKTEAVNSQLETELGSEDIHIGPSDYIEWLDDNKLAFIRLDGKKFGDVPVEVEVKLDVEDSSNSAGSAVDAIRGAKAALDRGDAGPIHCLSAYTMKHPPVQIEHAEAKAETIDTYGDENRV